MAIPPAQYQWHPDELYRHWNICDSCLIPLAEALQCRVETWHRPPAAEEDDSRPDYEEVYQRRFYEAFDRPLDDHLRQVDFPRALIWLSLHAPSVVAKLQSRLDALREALDPADRLRNTDSLIVDLANTAWYFWQLAHELRPLAESGKTQAAGLDLGKVDQVHAVRDATQNQIPGDAPPSTIPLDGEEHPAEAVRHPTVYSTSSNSFPPGSMPNTADSGDRDGAHRERHGESRIVSYGK